MMNIPNNAVDIELQKPPRLEENTLRLVPLGGLGEVGRNCAVVEMIDPLPKGDPRVLMLDCGVLFPGDDEPGVDLILPDFSYISDRLDKIEALVVTHAHEDHMGAIPFLLKLRADIPLVGTELTLEIIKKKLNEHRITPVTHIVKEGDTLRFGPFLLNFLPVNHSIPDALAVFVKTAAGNILDTGDFKIDQRPVDGRLTDLREFARAGSEGVDLFMVDSTNACNPGFVTSESDVAPEIDRLFAQTPEGIVFASTFASHIHRVQLLVNASMKYGRKVCFLGRTMVNNMAIAGRLKKIDLPQDAVIDIKDVPSLPPRRVTIICTGSQGEDLAALSRMSRNEHPMINITDKDTVILASSVVPGNEKPITALINRMLTRGAKVYNRDNAKVHCSGHANKGELEYIYNVVRPKNVLPIHGETRHLLANARIAQSTGLAPENTPTILDGGVIDLSDGRARVVGRIENGYVFVDGRQVGTVSDEDLKHRRILSEEGFIAVSAVVDLDAREVIAKPKIVAKAVAEADSVFYELPYKVKKALERAMQEDNVLNPRELSRIARRTVGKYAGTVLRRSPLILPMVTVSQETRV